MNYKKTHKTHKTHKTYKTRKINKLLYNENELMYDKNKLTQNEYTNIPSVVASFNYYNNIKNHTEENPLYAEMVNLIDSYQADFEEDEWADNPLPLSYAFLLWLFMYKEGNELGKYNIITTEQTYEQLENTKKLNNYLLTFPKSTDDIYVYSGYRCDNILNGFNTELNEITYNYLVSTSLNIDVAISFANTCESRNKRCLLRIKIPKGIMPLAFISNKLSMLSNNTDAGTESEILLPIGVTFTFPYGKEPTNINYKGLNYAVYDMEIVKINENLNNKFWNKYTNILDIVNSNRENNSNNNSNREVNSNLEPMQEEMSAGKKRKSKRRKNKTRKSLQKTKKYHKRKN